MTKVTKQGGMPKVLQSFLFGLVPGENQATQVWECTVDEIVKKAKEEKLEPQVIIDRENHRAYMAAVGFSFSRLLLPPFEEIRPSFYFAELSEEERRAFTKELNVARKEVAEKQALDDAVRAAKRAQKAQELDNE